MVKTRVVVVSPNSLSARSADLFKASIDRSRGILVSRASPVHDAKAVGMQRTAPLGFSRMKAGLVGSQAVYPRASKVARMPPVGKLEASGSPFTSSLPVNWASAVPSPTGAKNESCFSAVEPVRGWNQWVKWVAPRSSAQSFMAAATESARSGSSAAPRSIVSCSLRNASLGRRARCAPGPNTLAPKTAAPGAVRSPVPMEPFELHWAAVTFFCRSLGMARRVLLVRSRAAMDCTHGTAFVAL